MRKLGFTKGTTNEVSNGLKGTQDYLEIRRLLKRKEDLDSDVKEVTEWRMLMAKSRSGDLSGCGEGNLEMALVHSHLKVHAWKGDSCVRTLGTGIHSSSLWEPMHDLLIFNTLFILEEGNHIRDAEFFVVEHKVHAWKGDSFDRTLGTGIQRSSLWEPMHGMLIFNMLFILEEGNHIRDAKFFVVEPFKRCKSVLLPIQNVHIKKAVNFMEWSGFNAYISESKEVFYQNVQKGEQAHGEHLMKVLRVRPRGSLAGFSGCKFVFSNSIPILEDEEDGSITVTTWYPGGIRAEGPSDDDIINEMKRACITLYVALVKPRYMSSANDSERSSWGLWEQMRFMVMIVLLLAAWIACALLVFLPQQLSGCNNLVEVLETTSHVSTLIEDENWVWYGNASGLAKDAMGCVLCQDLELVNNIPMAFRYEFARSLTDKIIYDNAQYGSHVLVEVNKLVLEAGFARTMFLLGNSLKGSQRQQQSVEDGETAETFKELLRLVQKLHETLEFDVAILHWGSSSSLAELSVYTNLHVQRMLVKSSAYLSTANANIVAPMDVTLKLLRLWIRLLSKSTCNVDGAVFTSSEKHEAERTLERTILLLSNSELAVVLGLWLWEYALCASHSPSL